MNIGVTTGLIFAYVTSTWFLGVGINVCEFLRRSDQSFALVGDQLFMFGGYEEKGAFCKDLHVLDTGGFILFQTFICSDRVSVA